MNSDYQSCVVSKHVAQTIIVGHSRAVVLANAVCSFAGCDFALCTTKGLVTWCGAQMHALGPTADSWLQALPERACPATAAWSSHCTVQPLIAVRVDRVLTVLPSSWGVDPLLLVQVRKLPRASVLLHQAAVGACMHSIWSWVPILALHCCLQSLGDQVLHMCPLEPYWHTLCLTVGVLRKHLCYAFC